MSLCLAKRLACQEPILGRLASWIFLVEIVPRLLLYVNTRIFPCVPCNGTQFFDTRPGSFEHANQRQEHVLVHDLQAVPQPSAFS